MCCGFVQNQSSTITLRQHQTIMQRPRQLQDFGICVNVSDSFRRYPHYLASWLFAEILLKSFLKKFSFRLSRTDVFRAAIFFILFGFFSWSCGSHNYFKQPSTNFSTISWGLFIVVSTIWCNTSILRKQISMQFFYSTISKWCRWSIKNVWSWTSSWK